MGRREGAYKGGEEAFEIEDEESCGIGDAMVFEGENEGLPGEGGWGGSLMGAKRDLW